MKIGNLLLQTVPFARVVGRKAGAAGEAVYGFTLLILLACAAAGILKTLQPVLSPLLTGALVLGCTVWAMQRWYTGTLVAVGLVSYLAWWPVTILGHAVLGYWLCFAGLCIWLGGFLWILKIGPAPILAEERFN